MSESAESEFLIVSIDGGGMRGAIPCAILVRLDEEIPGWRRRVKMFAGTSTGTLISGGLAAGWEPFRLLEFYTDFGSVIFDRSLLEKLGSAWGLSAAMYSLDGLEAVLRGAFGTKKMGDVGPLVATAFDLDKETPFGRSWAPKVFENLTWPNTSDAEKSLVDVMLASSAAPVYFPDWKGFIDGGIYAGNPSFVALAQARDARNRHLVAWPSIKILSLGTGISPQYIEGEGNSRGVIDFGSDLVTMPISASGDIVAWGLDRMLGNRHFRFQPILPTIWGPDDFGAVPQMIEFSRSLDISGLARWLNP